MLKDMPEPRDFQSVWCWTTSAAAKTLAHAFGREMPSELRAWTYVASHATRLTGTF